MDLCKNYLFSIVLGFVLFTALFACSENIAKESSTYQKIDFQNVVKTVLITKQNKLAPSLKIAIAAMISPKTTYTYYMDLIDLVSRKLDIDVEFIQKKNYSQVNEMLKNKEVDLAFICSGPYVIGRKEFGLEIIAVPISHGENVYHSYFIVNKDSPFQTFDQLRNRIFAFTDPHSNTGCFVPTYVLAKREETPDSFFNKTFYSGSHDNSIKAVVKGIADAAAVNSLIWEFLNTVDNKLTSQTKIIEKSPPYGMPPIVVHPSMKQGMKDRLQTLFLSLHKIPEAKPILETLQIDRFERGNDADYNSVREMQT